MHMFSRDVERALHCAFKAHSGQVRKGGGIPYISHPVHVALLLARHGADDVTLQAALLHDVVEDCKGWTGARVEEEFGPEVAEVVAIVTEVKGKSWEERKQAALDHVPAMSVRQVGVKAADKTHNMQSLAIALDEARTPEEAWRPFTRGPEATIAYAERLVAALRARLEELGAFPGLSGDLQAAFDALAAHRP